MLKKITSSNKAYVTMTMTQWVMYHHQKRLIVTI